MAWINWVGLVFNFAGAVMLALSIARNRARVHAIEGGQVTYMAAIKHPQVLWIGLIVMAAGFVLQIVAEFPG